MAKFTQEDDALLAELGVDIQQKKPAKRTLREERIIAGFEEIQRFVDTNGRTPRHSEGCDIFERLYAVRLDRIREQEECRSLLAPFDHRELSIVPPEAAPAVPDDMDDDALLAELRVEADVPDIARLRHVRPSVEKRTA